MKLLTTVGVFCNFPSNMCLVPFLKEGHSQENPLPYAALRTLLDVPIWLINQRQLLPSAFSFSLGVLAAAAATESEVNFTN